MNEQQPAFQPLPFGVVPVHPVPTAVDVQAHPSGIVQLAISTPSGNMVVWMPKDFARDVARRLDQAASGLVIASGVPPSPLLKNGNGDR